ncbi:endonuclease/exonuclease/phosphatase family protein [Ulvibacterium sp.]|uniref:endonuclease/exonuclease/phosphatase family protein n=1 Tax=Ulvibacterium sp. TaxID=2665914 RepID=UPI00261D57ED|nr:endonuclease/exonuclease/phosphatase family protein [Ulvibacterium sp.]
MNTFQRIVPLLLIFLHPIDGMLAQETPSTLRILSYNIHYGVGMDGKKDLARIADVIKATDPDIVGLQEVADSTMMATLGRLTNMHNILGASTEKEAPNLYHLLDIPVPDSQLHYGDGILSKQPFAYVGNLSIPSASSSRYEAMCIDVDFSKEPGKKEIVRFITTHFDYLETIGSEMARKAAVAVIEAAFVDDKMDMGYILTGDLNATPDSEVLNLLEHKGWVKEDFGKELPTVPSTAPRKQIDYVLVRPKKRWKIMDIRVIYEPDASDHLPILMTLERISRD